MVGNSQPSRMCTRASLPLNPGLEGTSGKRPHGRHRACRCTCQRLQTSTQGDAVSRRGKQVLHATCVACVRACARGAGMSSTHGRRPTCCSCFPPHNSVQANIHQSTPNPSAPPWPRSGLLYKALAVRSPACTNALQYNRRTQPKTRGWSSWKSVPPRMEQQRRCLEDTERWSAGQVEISYWQNATK